MAPDRPREPVFGGGSGARRCNRIRTYPRTASCLNSQSFADRRPRQIDRDASWGFCPSPPCIRPLHGSPRAIERSGGQYFLESSRQLSLTADRKTRHPFSRLTDNPIRFRQRRCTEQNTSPRYPVHALAPGANFHGKAVSRLHELVIFLQEETHTHRRQCTRHPVW